MAMNVNDFFAAQRYNDVIFPQSKRAPGRPPKGPAPRPHGPHGRDGVQYDSSVSSAQKADSTQTKELSSAAKDLLNQMKRTYSNVDFMVAGSNDSADAQAQLANGTKKYSVLFTNDEIERMATDENYRKEMTEKMHEGFRRAATESFRIKSQTRGGLERDNLDSVSVVYNSDGTSSIYSKMMESLSAPKQQNGLFADPKQPKAGNAPKAPNATMPRKAKSMNVPKPRTEMPKYEKPAPIKRAQVKRGGHK